MLFKIHNTVQINVLQINLFIIYNFICLKNYKWLHSFTAKSNLFLLPSGAY